MTKRRNDEHSTEFGLWLRDQKPIDSSLGFVTTNIDYLWENYKTQHWMFIEEKRFMSNPSWCQQKQFDSLKKRVNNDPKYHGFHLIQFEKTSPEDGKTYLDQIEISKDDLLKFLRFELWKSR